MSNRAKWAHWKQPKPDRHLRVKSRIFGLACLVMGIPLLLAGLAGLNQHVFWFRDFSFVYGRPVISSTIRLLLFGGVLVLAGVASLFVRE